jgi:hypothetical protein
LRCWVVNLLVVEPFYLITLLLLAVAAALVQA